jgi:hypothetical protein
MNRIILFRVPFLKHLVSLRLLPRLLRKSISLIRFIILISLVLLNHFPPFFYHIPALNRPLYFKLVKWTLQIPKYLISSNIALHYILRCHLTPYILLHSFLFLRTLIQVQSRPRIANPIWEHRVKLFVLFRMIYLKQCFPAIACYFVWYLLSPWLFFVSVILYLIKLRFYKAHGWWRLLWWI